MPRRYRIYLLSAKSILSYAKEENGAVTIALNRDATRRCQLPGRQEQEENALFFQIQCALHGDGFTPPEEPSVVEDLSACIFRPSESKETVGVSPPSREKQVQVHGREATGVLFGKKWQRNASQSAHPRVIYSDWNPFLLRMESSPSMRIL